MPDDLAIPELALREMRTTDIVDMVAIEQQVNESPWPPQHFSTSLAAAHIGLVAEKKGSLIAYALASTVLDEAELLTIAVHPQYQKQGIAKYLLAELLLLAEKGQIKCCLLEVRASNRPAIALYEKYDFRQISVRKAYYPAKGQPEDALIFERNL